LVVEKPVEKSPFPVDNSMEKSGAVIKSGGVAGVEESTHRRLAMQKR
jgi:hypothetical protein